MKQQRIVISIVIFFVAVVFLGWYVFSSQDVRSAKKTVKEVLSDPESAQFRNIISMKSGICGETNSKNRMGGYVGFTRFFYLSASKAVIFKEFMKENNWDSLFLKLSDSEQNDVLDCMKKD